MEWEQIQVVGALSPDVRRFSSLVMLDDETVSQELAIEATNDHDLSLTDLRHASALPGGDIAKDGRSVGAHVQQLPVGRLTAFEPQSFNCVAVLLV